MGEHTNRAAGGAMWWMSLLCILVALSSRATAVVDVQVPLSGDVNVCYYCDGTCMSEIADVDGYLDKLTDGVTQIFGNSGIGITFRNLGNLGDFDNNKILGMSRFVDADTSGDDMLYGAMDTFWEEYIHFDKMRVYLGCDVGFWIGAQSEQLWKQTPIIGGATVGAMCRDDAFGVIKSSVDPQRLVLTLAHEIGHILLMYHDDDDIPSSVTKYETGWDGEYAYLLENITANCNGREGNCPDDYCVGTSAAPAMTPRPTRFSPCTLAYMAMWANFPSYIDTTCIGGGLSVDVDAFLENLNEEQKKGFLPHSDVNLKGLSVDVDAFLDNLNEEQKKGFQRHSHVDLKARELPDLTPIDAKRGARRRLVTKQKDAVGLPDFPSDNQV